MAIGKEYYPLIRSHGGLALDYASIAESDFTASAGAAYSPPDETDASFRRIVAARTIQILAECPGIVETFQTSAAILRLPANTVSDISNDSGDGRIFVMKNLGAGSLTIADYLGTIQFVLLAGLVILVVGNNNNTWDFIFTGKNTYFNNTATSFVSTNVEDAIKEGTTASGNASRGPTIAGFDGTGSSGRWLEFFQNNPSDANPFICAEHCQLVAISIVTSAASATGTARVFKNGVSLQDVSLTAQKKKAITGLSYDLPSLTEISVEIVSGSIARPQVYLFIRTLP